MKFSRRTRLLRNPFDATAYAAVFFLMVMFLTLGSRIYTPGVKIDLPVADQQPGVDRTGPKVALDEHGRYFYQNRLVEPAVLKTQLQAEVARSTEPLLLVIMMDKKARVEDVIQLQQMAREAGIYEALIATLPQPDAPDIQP